ncbi:MAG: M28 family metallopeptidase [Terriglobia bacterium]|jgi:N-acetylated-alpha-linked acidic dipeptidase
MSLIHERITGITLFCVLVAMPVATSVGQQTAGIRGFFPAAAARQADLEKRFRAVPTPERARADLKFLTAEPHVASTPGDYRTAQFVLEQFRAAGLDAQLVEYQVLLPMPKEVKIDLIAPVRRKGPTPEGGWHQPPDRRDPVVIAGYNAYSPSGDVTAEVVYANYGLPEDYDRLHDLGIDVAGKIVLVRYGKSFRGVKSYVAEKNHAAGVLIYSDPAEDGYRQGDTFPKGPWRPATGVQRGSILYLTDYAGDPLTPGVAATKEAKRLALQDATTLPRIPTAPLSAEDAMPILMGLGGPVAPQTWCGALPLTYHLGPGSSKVHLKLQMDFRLRTIWDVIARIPGATHPDEWVIVGNHRDAWVYGAADPSSGTAPLLAVARGLGELRKQGWEPQRTLILASWDAEEFGLMGSTEWAEEHAEELTRNAVAYLNMDSGVAGSHFGASAVPSLGPLIREVAEEVKDPNTGNSVYAVWTKEGASVRREGGIPYAVLNSSRPAEGGSARIGDLGSGSDYTPFLQHLGVPALDVNFGGSYGVYHSIYDNFQWMETFGDPHFQYSVAAAQILGTLALRLAEADVLPFDQEEYGRTLQRYLADFEEEVNKSGEPARLPLNKVRAAAEKFTGVAKELNQRIGSVTAAGGTNVNPSSVQDANRALMEVERAFLLPGGLPQRAWFRHAFYAPGVYTGYSAVIFPGVREAMARQDWTTAAEQIEQLQITLERGTQALTRALLALGGAGNSSGH